MTAVTKIDESTGRVVYFGKILDSSILVSNRLVYFRIKIDQLSKKKRRALVLCFMLIFQDSEKVEYAGCEEFDVCGAISFFKVVNSVCFVHSVSAVNSVCGEFA